MKEKEYQEVTDHMSQSLRKTPNKKRPVQKEPEDPEKKRRKEAAAAKSSQMRKCKQTIDKLSNEMSNMSTDIPKLLQKGYPPQMVEWCETKVNEMKEHMSCLQVKYNSEVIKVTCGQTTFGTIDQETKMLEQALVTLEQQHSEWKKTAGAEVKKLLA